MTARLWRRSVSTARPEVLPQQARPERAFAFMALSAPRPCPYPGCGVLGSGGYCAKHAQQASIHREQYRESAHKRGYDSRWKSARAGWLRQHPLCGDRADGPSPEHSECLQARRLTAATDVDHIVPHRGDKSLFWERTNWQSLCHACHSAKTAREDGGFGNGASRQGEGVSNP